MADVTYIDGVRVGETVLNRTRLKDPVNQVIARGTQTIDDYFASTGGRFIWPADGGYFYGSLGSYGGHTGMDIACPLGTTVRASKAGTVTTALNYGWNYGYGKTVVINHGYGQITRYAHMSNVIVTVGQYVKQGQVIGYSGSTGNSTGPAPALRDPYRWCHQGAGELYRKGLQPLKPKKNTSLTVPPTEYSAGGTFWGKEARPTVF